MIERLHRTNDERGIAMIAAILVVVLVAIMVTIAVAAIQAGSGDVKREGQRSTAFLVAQGAAHDIQQQLQAAGFVLGDSLAVNGTSIRTAAQASDSTITPGAVDYQFPTGAGGTPAALQFTVLGRPDPSTGRQPAWQVLRIDQPSITATPPRGDVTILVRGWTRSGTNVSAPITLQARLRPGTFFDYQVVSDVAIPFDAAARITGSVHTNGFIEDQNLPPVIPSDRVWTTGGTVSCTTPAGGTRPVVSTTVGTVSNVSSSTCDLRVSTNETISLARTQESFRALASKCGPGVTCFTASSPTTVYTVNLATLVVTSSGGGFARSGSSVRVANGIALLFDRDVRVSGTATGRVTIATRSTSPTVNATDIHVAGNAMAAPSSASAQHALALLAEHDVVVDMAPGSCPTTTIRAALVAMTGAFTIPRPYRQQFSLADALPTCGGLTVQGSIASHGSIVMKWTVDGRTAGYSARTYSWDPWMGYNPPPYVPLTHPWELESLQLADGDCVTGAKTSAAACA